MITPLLWAKPVTLELWEDITRHPVHRFVLPEFEMVAGSGIAPANTRAAAAFINLLARFAPQPTQPINFSATGKIRTYENNEKKA